MRQWERGRAELVITFKNKSTIEKLDERVERKQQVVNGKEDFLWEGTIKAD